MKRSFLILGLLVIVITAIAQKDTGILTQPDIQSTYFEGIKLFTSYLNWTYIITFILVAWLLNDLVDSSNETTRWLNWFNRIPKVIRSLAIGNLLVLFFVWGFYYNTRMDIVSLMLSLISSMVLYKIGINKVLRFISVHLLRLEFN